MFQHVAAHGGASENTAASARTTYTASIFGSKQASVAAAQQRTTEVPKVSVLAKDRGKTRKSTARMATTVSSIMPERKWEMKERRGSLTSTHSECSGRSVQLSRGACQSATAIKCNAALLARRIATTDHACAARMVMLSSEGSATTTSSTMKRSRGCHCKWKSTCRKEGLIVI